MVTDAGNAHRFWSMWPDGLRIARQDVGMHEVDAETLKITLLASVLTPERARRTPKSATRARATFGAARTVDVGAVRGVVEGARACSSLT